MRYKTWREFFEAHDTSYIGLDSYGGETHVSLEDLYQHFKARIMTESLLAMPQTPGLYPLQPEGTIIKVVEAPAMPKGVAVFRDKDDKEVGRITGIGDE